MNYSQAKTYLMTLAKIPRKEYLKDPTDCNWYLKRLQFFLDLLGNPENKISHYIHVTGTSGKGSVCLMLDSILRAAGKKVGTLTSPHPSEIVERWEVNGKMMTEPEFANLTTIMKPFINQCLLTTPYDLPSLSELMTALGLYYFSQKKIDYAILEVGLGGRYDSTNIIPHKDVAIITNIGLDHTELIGPTKKEIAYEKAGIVKRGCVIFTGEKDKKILSIIKTECCKQGVQLVIPTGAKRSGGISSLSFVSDIPRLRPDANRDFARDDSGMGAIFKYRKITYKLPVLGEHQIKNAILAINVATSLKISSSAIKIGLAKVKLPIRMEVVSKRPLIILDGAHNPDKMKTTVQTVTEVRSPKSEVHLVVGFSADKDITTMIKQLASLRPTTIACAKFTNNKLRQPADPKFIAKLFRRLLPKAKIKTFDHSLAAYNWSKKQQKNNELLLVTGSMFLAGQLRQFDRT